VILLAELHGTYIFSAQQRFSGNPFIFDLSKSIVNQKHHLKP